MIDETTNIRSHPRRPGCPIVRMQFGRRLGSTVRFANANRNFSIVRNARSIAYLFCCANADRIIRNQVAATVFFTDCFAIV